MHSLWPDGHATVSGSRFTKDRRLIMRIVLAGLLMTGLVALAYRPQRDPMPQLPRIMLWAWERPEKLDFINSREIGVAFLARTIRIHGGLVTVRPRLQPLVVAPGTA